MPRKKFIGRRLGEPRDHKLSIALPASQKERWETEAERRDWTLTTLVEQAVEWYLHERQGLD